MEVEHEGVEKEVVKDSWEVRVEMVCPDSGGEGIPTSPNEFPSSSWTISTSPPLFPYSSSSCNPLISPQDEFPIVEGSVKSAPIDDDSTA